MAKRWGFSASLLVLSPLLVFIPLLAIWKHYELPEPLLELHHPVTKHPQLSEAAILSHAKYLSEDIGYRSVGTREHALGDAWMLRKAEELKKLCEKVVEKEPGRKLECEIWRQVGSGSHRFDILQARLYKTYVNLTNIVLRISNGTPEGKEHAVLVNAHLDSTLPSPGAADDALAAGVMLEVARNLIETRGWSPSYSIILLWNNAEESLQDGSHLFSTQHPIRDTVRAVVNLEAAGTKGPELLFQATSEQMIQAYSHVPNPYGTVVANEVFSSGIIMSDTDFRQFELYLNVTGLDMAVVGHSYFYHTRKDLVEYIEPGVAQHMAENTLALMEYLSSPESPLPTLTTGYTKPTTVFFSLLNLVFVQYSFSTANALHFILLVSSVLLVYYKSSLATTTVTRMFGEKEIMMREDGEEVSVNFIEYTETVKQVENTWMSHAKSMVLVGFSVVAALCGVNVVAFFMSRVFDRPLSWYKVEFSCMLLYGPAALASALTCFYILSRFVRPMERVLFNAILLSMALLAVILQLLGIGSAGLFFLSACSILVGLLTEPTKSGPLSLSTYAIAQSVPLLLGTEVFTTVSDIFVPLTGRMGSEAPAENIIATSVAITSSYLLPLVLPFFHRFGPRFVMKSAINLTFITGIMMAIFAQLNPYDAMHPKRLYIIHSENITSNEVSLNIGTSDSAPKFELLTEAIADFVTKNTTRANKVDVHEYTAEWNTIYPFSAFVSPYKIELDSYVSSWATNGKLTVKAVNDVVDKVAGTRSLKLVIYHPGLIWTTIAFDARVLKWSLDDNPPEEYARHYVKEASFYGEDTWSVDLIISLSDIPDPSDHSLRVDIVGIKEKAMWPGKKAEKEEGGHAMRLFEELDPWLESYTAGTVDALMIGCVGGVVRV